MVNRSCGGLNAFYQQRDITLPNDLYLTCIVAVGVIISCTGDDHDPDWVKVTCER